ncbi:MAG: DUF917 domain-containing protein [Pseudomonadota bacterium]
MVRISRDEEIEDLARGMVLLGTGGGGDPYVGALYLQSEVHAGKFPELISAADIDDDAFVLSVFGIGAPTAILEGLLSRRTLMEIVDRAEKHFGRKIDALVSGEIGGVNTLFPLGLGAALDIPILDADGMGRAFPHIEMTTFSIFGCPSTPALIMDELGNSIVLHTVDDQTSEKLSRSISADLGAITWGAFYPMTGRDVKATAVHGSVTQAWEIGRCIREARLNSDDVVNALADHMNEGGARFAKVLFQGKVTDVAREIRNSWDFALITIAGSGDSKQKFTIELQNEFIVARIDGEPVCLVPDMICVVQSDSGEPLTGEMLTYGQRVSVIGYQAHPMLRHPKSIAVCGPRQFGVDEDFKPIEELVDQQSN